MTEVQFGKFLPLSNRGRLIQLCGGTNTKIQFEINPVRILQNFRQAATRLVPDTLKPEAQNKRINAIF